MSPRAQVRGFFMNKSHKIILFDGVCNLCNGAVTYIIKRDNKNIFKFAALQSEIGQKLTSKFKIDTSKVDSIILIDGEKHYEKSSAALYIAKNLYMNFNNLYEEE